ncbi:MAG: radical SAM protein, partial [Candidatus Omnitrophota bacterium]|nr:radical SAM protein [Candidatus Omnitrophota bacterium]
MNILIINPPVLGTLKFVKEGRCQQRAASFQYSMVPISLPYIAANLLKAGYEVKILDCIVNNYDISQVIKIVKESLPRLIIVNISTPTFYSDKKFIAEVKKITNCHISAIGTHVTALPQESLQDTLLDSVIRAEPEMTTKELADCLRDGSDLCNIKGISFRNERNTIIHNPGRPFIENLDSLPFPARQLLDNQKYLAPLSRRSCTLIVATRGCPYSCIFCNAHLYYGKETRTRSIANIIEEIKEVLFRYKIEEIVFWADTFTINRELVIGLCNAILDNRLIFPWSCNSRVDTIDEEMLSLMAKAGCYIISYGIESGSQEILDNIKKRTTIAEIKNTIYLTHKYNIDTSANLILGLPGENRKTLIETARLIKLIRPTFIQVYGAIPYPGTEFYKLALENQWLATKNWSSFEINQLIVRTPALSVKDL